MTSIATPIHVAPPVDLRAARRTARETGLAYLGLAVTGMLGFMVVRSRLFADDPQATLAHLVDHEGLTRLGILLELGVVLTQALAAVWFWRLFRRVNGVAAASIAAFGLVNAVAILTSAAALATALDISQDASLAAPGGAAATVQLLYVLSGHLWATGGIFFGLWLIPMGWLALRSGWMPAPLGWTLMIGGVGYVLGTFSQYALPDVPADLLTVPATIGELWMVGYLLIRGVRRYATV